MIVNIKLFAGLRAYNQKETTLNIPENFLVHDIIKSMGIPIEEVSIVMINGRISKFDSIVVNNDTVAMFPMVGGG